MLIYQTQTTVKNQGEGGLQDPWLDGNHPSHTDHAVSSTRVQTTRGIVPASFSQMHYTHYTGSCVYLWNTQNQIFTAS